MGIEFKNQNPESSVFNIVNMNQTSDTHNDPSSLQFNPANKPMNKFSKMLEDIDLEGDPFYLLRYRGYHNHELDTNLIENEGLVSEHDTFRRGAANMLP